MNLLTANRIIVTACALVALAGGGCGSRFAGEWVQESIARHDGTLDPVRGERRMALQFIPPSTVRMGMYVDSSGVVEDETVASSDYQTIQDRSVAEFGAFTARVENGELIAYLGGEETWRFRRLHGKSVFPPLVKLPQFVRANQPADAPDVLQSAEAVIAVAK